MTIVAAPQRIASAFHVQFGQYGDVGRYAQERGVCRQWVYREAAWVIHTLEGKHRKEEFDRLRTRLRELERENSALQKRLVQAVVLDDDKQAEFASVGQALGVSLPECRELLEVLLPGQIPSVATLGRRTQAAGAKAGPLLQVLDEWTAGLVREALGDEIYVRDPVLMVVEPESLCWLRGQKSDAVTGAAWAQELRDLRQLEQFTRDAGKGLEKGVALVNAERHEQGLTPVVDQGDHYHALRGGSVGLRQVQSRASQALAEAEAADRELAAAGRQGHALTGPSAKSRAAWRRAEKAMDTWCERERIWNKTKGALQLITEEGELNTRAHAEAVLAQTLPQLPEQAFAKTKRLLSKPEMLNYLDRVQSQVAALPLAEEVKAAAVRQEGLRRRPELLRGESAAAAALRGVLLVCAVVLGKAGEQGSQAVQAVQEIFRRAQRASSLVECINSVLRMQQARHRKLTQGLLDLKRLYWNCHVFRTGRRRKTTPYQRLGIAWPEGLRWWEVLKLTPEQLRDKLSTAKRAA
jgi:hypothetical protein